MSCARLSKRQARQLDTLAKRAHAFHRWAHHPLCHAYRDEIWRVGRRTRICLGCTLSALGVMWGAAAAWLPAPGPVVALTGTCVLGATWHVRCRLRAVGVGVRWPKTTARLLPAAAVGFITATALTWQEPRRVAVLATLCMGGATLRLLYKQRGPHRQACATCPERAALPTCSGFLPMYQRERAFQRLAQRLIRKLR